MIDEIRRELRKEFQRVEDEQRSNEKKEVLQAEFEATDKSKIKEMSDADLARWQSKYQKESPQAIFSEQLWKYRLARHSAKFAAMIAIGSAILGGIIGYTLRGNQNEINQQNTTEKIKSMSKNFGSN